MCDGCFNAKSSFAGCTCQKNWFNIAKSTGPSQRWIFFWRRSKNFLWKISFVSQINQCQSILKRVERKTEKYKKINSLCPWVPLLIPHWTIEHSSKNHLHSARKSFHLFMTNEASDETRNNVEMIQIENYSLSSQK